MAFVIMPIYAKKVELEKAEKLAQNFFRSKHKLQAESDIRLKFTATNGQKTSSLRSNVTPQIPEDTVYYYVFNVNESAKGGFVIVAGDDAVKPVLGYSDNGNYDENNLPPNFAYWMDYLQSQIKYAQIHNLPQSKTIKDEWDNYLSGNISSSTSAVEPLIKTQWDQWAPYNNLCPKTEGTPTPTGCVATAMAQIMKYYNFPAQGSGHSLPYKTKTYGLSVSSVNLEVNYDWANMSNTYTGSETQQQQDAVATLMYHCGASILMDYALDGSNSNFNLAREALITNFGYDKNMQTIVRSDYSNAEWEAKLRAQIDAKLPVYYDCDIHAFICDGYDNTGAFHFNWGWGGLYDGYFTTSALYPGNIDFNSDQLIITNIKPAQGYLTELNVSAGKLSPAFRSYVFDYTVHVDASVETVDITGITNITGATITGNVTNLPLTLNDCTDAVIQVTLPDGDSQNYTISIIRGSIPPVSFTWKTDSIGQTVTNFIGIYGDSCIIDWSDGTKPDTIATNEEYQVFGPSGHLALGNWISHTYDLADTYQTTIKGQLYVLNLNLWSDWISGAPVPGNDNVHFVNIDIRNALYLRSLSVLGGEIDYLDVSYNKKLELLDCGQNRLKEFNLNSKLKSLNCSDNQLINLDVSHNPLLTQLHCSANQLTNLDVSYNPLLNDLICNYNQLTELDVSHNPLLGYFYCGNNQLTNLDVSNNSLLYNFGCNGNQLTDLDINNNPLLIQLWCFENSLPLTKLYELSQKFSDPKHILFDPANIMLGQQSLSDTTVTINSAIAIDTVFHGVNSVFNINTVATNYKLSNGEITFLTPGSYWVSVTNPAIISSPNAPASVTQSFHVTGNTRLNNILQIKNLNAWIQDGTLHVSGLTAGKPWSVCNAAGAIVHQGIAAGDVETWHAASLPHGAYIIQSGKEAIKVIF